MRELGAYFLSVASVSILISVLQTVLRDGAVRRCVLFLCGLVLTVTAVSPLIGLSPTALSGIVPRSGTAPEERRSELEERQNGLLEKVISRKAEAYILDKAAEMNCSVEAAVTAETGTVYPYPAAAEIRGALTPEEKAELGAYLNDALGIPPERQRYVP